MSGRDLFCQPRRFGRGAALTLVFASVLVAGAATGSLPGPERKSPSGAAAAGGAPAPPPRPARGPPPARAPPPTPPAGRAARAAAPP
ncbi:peptidase S41, partial [Streptomyces sp. NPDC059374]